MNDNNEAHDHTVNLRAENQRLRDALVETRDAMKSMLECIHGANWREQCPEDINRIDVALASTEPKVCRCRCTHKLSDIFKDTDAWELLCDLMRHADQNNWDFQKALRYASLRFRNDSSEIVNEEDGDG